MKQFATLAAGTLLAASQLTAATLYVSIQSTNAIPPYTNWATAGTNLQQAINLAAPEDEVLVTDGTYAPITVTKPLRIRSQYGPAFTFIDGGGTNRCAWLTNGASLTGFWLHHGVAEAGAGVFCASAEAFLTNCWLRNNSAVSRTDPNIGQGGGAFGGTLVNCSILVNTAGRAGAGACSNTLCGCILANNSPTPGNSLSGGGAYGCQLFNCTLNNNSAAGGGGAAWSDLYDCTVSANYASEGGGVAACTLSNCVVNGNQAGGSGGGLAACSTVVQCAILGNSASALGGGVYVGSLTNCVIAGNSSGDNAGGVFDTKLDRCTVTNNSAARWFGGVWVTSCYNSLVAGNHAGSYGGGSGSFYNCLIVGNSATTNCGGISGSKIYSCTVVSNSAGVSYGGVSSTAGLNNCIVYFNTPDNGGSPLSAYSCTIPMQSGAGNITNAPQFVNAAAGDFRLLGTSPCINAGNNASAAGSTDLAGNPRIVGGALDMGAYEFQGTNSGAYYGWLQTNGVTADGLSDYADADRDGLNNWQEWRCGTSPTNAHSALRLVSAVPQATRVAVTWQSVAGVNYFLEASTNLAGLPCFGAVVTNWPGLAGTTLYTDTNDASAGPRFYRVGVASQ